MASEVMNPHNNSFDASRFGPDVMAHRIDRLAYFGRWKQKIDHSISSLRIILVINTIFLVLFNVGSLSEILQTGMNFFERHSFVVSVLIAAFVVGLTVYGILAGRSDRVQRAAFLDDLKSRITQDH